MRPNPVAANWTQPDWRNMNSKPVLTASAAAFGIFGAGWLIVPEMFYKYWAIVPDTNQYMGRRYGAFMLGLNAWWPFGVELILVVGFVWVLFIKPEPGM